MATRRYHKKRVSRKGRKVGRKSRRMKGGKLKKVYLTKDEITWEKLDGVIRTKKSKLAGITKDLYQIEIVKADPSVPVKLEGNLSQVDTNDPNNSSILYDYMIWHPLAFNTSQNLARASIGLQNAFKSVGNAVGYNSGEAEEYPAALFRKNVHEIYKGLEIGNNFDKISKAPLGKVTLKYMSIMIEENDTKLFYPINTSDPTYNADKFKENVVNFYKGDVITD